MTQYPKGSEWRRWDLHVHTPCTKLSNAYTGFDDNLGEFVNRIEKCSADVIGITDYFSVDSYCQFIDRFQKKYPHSKKVFFPNIELRLSETISGDDRKCPDLHIIFDNNKNHCSVEEIKSFLGALKLYEKGINGQDVFAASLSSKKDFESATVSQADVKTALQVIFGTKKPYLIAFPANNDGIKSTDTQSPRKVLISDELDKSSDLFFGKMSNREYFLDTSRYEKGEAIPKPVVSGSDAHSFDDLQRINQPTENFEFTWIKADPTFEGLKQILYEPEERVWIGPEPPDSRDPQRILSKVTTQSRPDWLNWLDEIELNTGLVCIIGNKGSGKTALLDIIAHTAGAYDSDIGGSFIEKAKDELESNGMKASLRWQKSDDEEVLIRVEGEKGNDKKVTYLPQQVVENLCDITKRGKLSSEIERIIYDKTPKPDQLECNDFDSLREKRLKSVMQERQEKKDLLHKHIGAWCKIQSKMNSLLKTQAKVDRLEAEKKGIEVPKLPEEAMQKVSVRIDELGRLEAGMQGNVAEINAQLQEVDDIKSIVERQDRVKEEYFSSVSKQLEALNFEEEEISQFKLKFAGEPIDILQKKKKELEGRVVELTGKEADETEETLSGIRYLLNQQKALFNIDKASRDRITEAQKRKNQTEQDLKTLEMEIMTIGAEAAGVEIVKKYIMDAYRELLNTYVDEEKVDITLCAPLKIEIETKRTPFEVDIERNVASSNWKSGLGELVHGITGKSILESIENHVGQLNQLWKKDKEDNLSRKVWEMVEKFEEGGEVDVENIENKLKGGAKYENLLKAIFDTSHISINYSLKYNGLPLASMSPGTKGMALMILYLELNEHDRRPLLVDQPEENLDNESIYNELRKFFRDAKKRRQIIMVTHNPNLVVNTDADQIIVTHIEQSGDGKVPILSLTSGSIENSEIRKEICSILEGGTDAFKKREDRYEL